MNLSCAGGSTSANRIRLIWKILVILRPAFCAGRTDLCNSVGTWHGAREMQRSFALLRMTGGISGQGRRNLSLQIRNFSLLYGVAQVTSVTTYLYRWVQNGARVKSMSSSKFLLFPVFALLLTVAAGAEKKQPPPPPAHAKAPSPAVTDELIHKQFGDNCSLLTGPPQFVADMDDDGVEDLVVAAKCKNPMADKDEYSFVVADPFDSFLGYSDVKVTSSFASDEPERRGISLLIIHGDEKDGWQAEKPKAKFLLINLPFKTLTVKRLTMKKKAILGIYMEEKGVGEETSSVVFWDGKKYKYQALGSTLE